MCRCCICGCGPAHHREGHLKKHRFGYRRRFLTKAERAEKLEKYAEELRKELEAVEERIKELEG